MYSGERHSGTEQETSTEQNQWEKMASEAPPFRPDQNEAEKPEFTEKALAEVLLEQSADRQDDLANWIDGVHNGYGMDEAYYSAYDQFCRDNVNASEEDWVQSLEREFADLEARDGLLISALEDLDSPKNTGKSLEEILNARSDKEQDTINALVQSGAWGNKWTDEQRSAILARRDTYQSLAEQAKSLRNTLELDMNETEPIDDTATPERHETEGKPDTLYRGVKISYKDLPDFKFSGENLVVNYEPIIDEKGRKTVSDGNEYGVYMSDNLSMVEYAYGNLHHDGTPISKLQVNYQQIAIPDVAVIYQIDTDGLDIREPFISDTLQGHYNNGFQGKEWIADSVPADHYSLRRVRIGEDILHNAEDIDLQKAEDLSVQVQQKLEARRKRLEVFVDAVEKMSPAKRRMIDGDRLNTLKTIYGEDGLKYINEDNLDTDSIDGMLKFLAAKTFKQDEANIDFQTLDYIKNLEKQAEDVDSLVEVLHNDQCKNTQEKAAFEERKKQAGESYQTSRFDKKDARINDLLSLIASRTGEDGEQPIISTNGEKPDIPAKSAKRAETQTNSTETDAEDDETEEAAEQDSAIVNSEAEIQAIIGALESMRPDIQQLFAMSRGSFSMEQAAGYLLISNQRMMDSTGIYTEVLKNAQDVGQIEQSAAVYDRQIGIDYGSSINAINVIRQKVQNLPTSLKVPMLTYCQNIENTLGQIMATVQKKDGKIHNTPAEKQAADDQELEEAFGEEMSV